jgi:opacity protein-like surface antigen
MKKVSFLAVALIATLAVTAQVQNPDMAHKPLRTDMEVKPRFGIKAGVNLAKLNIDDDESSTSWNATSKTSFHGGLFANIPLGGALRLQPEIIYSGQGSKLNGPLLSNTGTSENYEVDLHYVNIPIMFQLQGASGFYGELGPQVGFLVNAEQDRNTGGSTDIKDWVKKTDFALGAGIGYTTRVGLGVGARFNYSFSNVWNRDGSTSPLSNGEMNNRVIQLGLSYQFGANR